MRHDINADDFDDNIPRIHSSTKREVRDRIENLTRVDELAFSKYISSYEVNLDDRFCYRGDQVFGWYDILWF